MPKIGNLVMSVYREESASLANYHKALCAASAEFLPVALDQTGYRGGKSYRYASLRSIRRATQPALTKHSLFLNHVYAHSDHGEFVVTILRHVSGEFVTSTLRISERSDPQEQKAERTLACRTATEGLLAICTEEDDDAACVVVDAAKQAQWQSNLDLALKAIASAKNESEVIRYATLAADRIAEGAMAPDAMVEINTRCDDRRNQLQGAKNADNARTAGTQGKDAARSGSGSPDREQGRSAGVGRGDVSSGDKRAVGVAV